MASIIEERSPDPRICGHEEIERLDHTGETVFLRCVACGSILIAQGPRRWIIRLTDETGPLRA